MTVDRRKLNGLRDPAGISEAVLTVARATASILALLDGSRTLLDVTFSSVTVRGPEAAVGP